jgi:hypothetical protein
MNRKRKTELDLIGRRIFERSGLDAEAIEHIASSPNAYNSVLTRIKKQEAASSATVSGKRMFGLRRVVAAVCVLVAVSFVSLWTVFRDDKEVVTEYKIDLPVPPPETARPQTPPGDIVSEQQTSDRARYSDTAIEKVSFKKPSPQRVRRTADEAPLADFVSLGLSTSPQHTADGGRVIRVELPAASLFAMGVNVPIENGSEMVKADLIVGPDGVTRAVKLVE